MKTDISTWFTPERALAEEVSWCISGCHKVYLDFVLPRIEDYKVKSIVEFCPRSGHVAAKLPDGIDYLGIEPNDWFRTKAEMRCPGKKFQSNPPERTADLSMAWMILKHTDFDQLEPKMAFMLGCGRYVAFDYQQASIDLDNGVEYPHTFLTQETLTRAVAGSGHEIVETNVLGEFDVEGLGKCRHVLMWTRMVEP